MTTTTLLELGQLCMTPGAQELFANPDAPSMISLVQRHQRHDWGDLEDEDKQLNDESVERGMRVMSAYNTEVGRVWIVTEDDRSVTTVLLPREY